MNSIANKSVADSGIGKSPLCIAVVGCGNMGGAIVRGLVDAAEKGLAEWASLGTSVLLVDSSQVRAESLARECASSRFKFSCSVDLGLMANDADLFIVSVKPKDVAGVLQTLRQAFAKRDQASRAQPLVASVAAGVKLDTISQYLEGSARVARIMPSIPCVIGAGLSGVLARDLRDEKLLTEIFSCIGLTVSVRTENELDAITGLSASGVAFVCCVIEALADGGVKMGLARSSALLTAQQTVLGTAKLLLANGLHPAELKDQVASPGGTTIAGLHELERGGLRGLLISAVEAAVLKAREF